VITGSGVPDTISAGAGADVVQLAFPAGPDEVTGDALDRVEIDGTAVDDTLEVHAAAPSAIVGGGISAPRNARVTSTGVGLIVLFGLGGDDSLAGDAGLAALGVRLVADGGDGDDRLRIDGTEGADVITVGAGGTVEVADVELVIVDGKAGDDTIDGSALSAATALSIAGGAGDDDLLGGDGDDTFAAALPAGVDHVQGGGGDDGVLYTGGKGNDDCRVERDGEGTRLHCGATSIVEASDVERLQASFGPGDDVVDAQGQRVAEVTLDGGLGSDTFTFDALCVATFSAPGVYLAGDAVAVSVVGFEAESMRNAPSLTPDHAAAGKEGDVVDVELTTGPDCFWEAEPAVSWLDGEPASGFGPATVGIVVEPNPTPAQRTGTISLAGITVFITQEAGDPPDAGVPDAAPPPPPDAPLPPDAAPPLPPDAKPAPDAKVPPDAMLPPDAAPPPPDAKPSPDAAAPPPDAAPLVDAAAPPTPDATLPPDAAPTILFDAITRQADAAEEAALTPEPSGCSCRAGGGDPLPGATLLVLFLLARLRRARRPL